MSVRSALLIMLVVRYSAKRWPRKVSISGCTFSSSSTAPALIIGRAK